MNDEKPLIDKVKTVDKGSDDAEAVSVDETERLTAELQDAHDKYLRLYAEFENYKKRVSKDKEELVKYGNEKLLHELLPVIDHLEMALKHASNDASSGLVQGVEITLKELKKTLQKFGITEIAADGQAFDPLIHHAMAQVERDDVAENTVIEEYRKGYMLNEKVIRAAMVAVSKKPIKEEKTKIEIRTKEEE
jgi:molecular chaperone GrpE